MLESLVMPGEHSQTRQVSPLARKFVDAGAVALWPIPLHADDREYGRESGASMGHRRKLLSDRDAAGRVLTPPSRTVLS